MLTATFELTDLQTEIKSAADRSCRDQLAPRLGEVRCAFVVPEDDGAPTLSELRDHFACAGATRQFSPEQLHVLAHMPMTPSGTFQKFEFRDLARGDVSSIDGSGTAPL